MKKILFMLGCAAAVLASCVKSEVIDVADTRVIGFEPFVNKATKVANQIQQAGPEATDNLYRFWVFGYDDSTLQFKGTDDLAKLYYSSTLQGFTYDNHQIWKLNDTYNFAAYSDGNYALTNTQNATTVTNESELKVEYSLGDGSKPYSSCLVFEDYTVSENDLLAAITRPFTPRQDSDITPVPFQFQHMLSCVQISIVNSSKDFYLRVADINLTAGKMGDCTYSINKDAPYTKTIEWENIESGSYRFESKFPITNDNMVNAEGFIAPGAQANMICFVLPQSNQDLTADVSLQTYIKENDKFESTQSAAQTMTANFGIPDTIISGHESWKPGYQYIYKAELSGTAHYIHFRVESVDNWIKTEVSTASTAGSN